MDYTREALTNILSAEMELEELVSRLPKAEREELQEEYNYGDPNNFKKVQKLYASYGIDYPEECMIVAQARFLLANRLTEARLKRERGVQ